nr:MMPL family transporter [uncultured Pedobacter sp.]
MIWINLSQFILKQRKSLIALFIVISAIATWKATQIKIAFNPGKILPSTDSTFIKYQHFKQKFGEDGTVMVLGVKTKDLFEPTFYQNWRNLHQQVEKIKGVKQVLSIAGFVSLKKDTLNKSFTIVNNAKLAGKQNLDSLKTALYQLPFYQGILYNDAHQATIMAITLDSNVLKSSAKISLVKDIEKQVNSFKVKQNLSVHLSGLPYIKTVLSSLVAKEFALFFALSVLISAFILWLFFKRMSSVIYPLILVIFGVVWSLAFMVLSGYDITLLTGIIAPLMVIIGVPNSILIINGYRFEIAKVQDKRTSLLLTIQKNILTTFIANLTTAIGFGVLYFTDSNVLQEFGVTAAFGVMFTWLICMVMLPILLSYLDIPSAKTDPKDSKTDLVTKFLNWVVLIVTNRQKLIYSCVALFILSAFFCLSKLKTNGFVVDDLPKSNKVYTDLKFFENTFHGILPLEFDIATRKKNNIIKISTLTKIDELEKTIRNYPTFGKSISINNAIKYASQTFYNGKPEFYRVPNQMEAGFILAYSANSGKKNNMLKNFVDSTKSSTRVTFQMRDIGSEKVTALLKELKPKINKIFNPKIYEVNMTGPVVMYTEGTNYLVKNLKESLLLAIGLIAIIMWILFRTLKMVIISLLPNLIPLLITAGIMGYFGMALKPSTVLIFSIALGIASDQTVYFLTHYQQELKKGELTVLEIIIKTIKETGRSMIYTATILFFGFGIFVFSTFGGTVALGVLLAVTLVMAMLFNLIFLPVLLISKTKESRS